MNHRFQEQSELKAQRVLVRGGRSIKLQIIKIGKVIFIKENFKIGRNIKNVPMEILVIKNQLLCHQRYNMIE